MTQAYLSRTQLQERIAQAAASAPDLPTPAAPAKLEEDPLSKEVANRNASAIAGMMAMIPGAGRARG